MGFIDYWTGRKISKWMDKHPIESDAYFKEHNELSQLFIKHEIPFEEFEKCSNDLKEKYHWLDC